VAACSTGEEAYSLAMLTREVLGELGIRRDVRIFATDIDKEALRFAAAGVYPESVAADLSPRYLAEYFIQREESFQVARTVREMVDFTPHNLIEDPPFPNIDLVSCRNVLIYLQPKLQRRVLDCFYSSLLPSGVLFLGTSETAGEAAEVFELADSKNRIYRSAGRSRARPA
jgi:two-component system CheB/CheR fusion protein